MIKVLVGTEMNLRRWRKGRPNQWNPRAREKNGNVLVPQRGGDGNLLASSSDSFQLTHQHKSVTTVLLGLFSIH